MHEKQIFERGGMRPTPTKWAQHAVPLHPFGVQAEKRNGRGGETLAQRGTGGVTLGGVLRRRSTPKGEWAGSGDPRPKRKGYCAGDPRPKRNHGTKGNAMSDTQDARTTKPTARRKKGGQPGNRNAIKHGIYARFIAVRDDEEMADMSNKDTGDELALARVRLVNALNEYKRAARKREASRMVEWDNSVLRHIEAITSIKLQGLDERESETCLWQSIMDALREVNERQKVKR
jgi:hypothetical protein